jgi:hypothetical protein
VEMSLILHLPDTRTAQCPEKDSVVLRKARSQPKQTNPPK